jgi:hypothetical protein
MIPDNGMAASFSSKHPEKVFAHLASYSTGTTGYFPWGKVTST